MVEQLCGSGEGRERGSTLLRVIAFRNTIVSTEHSSIKQLKLLYLHPPPQTALASLKSRIIM